MDQHLLMKAAKIEPLELEERVKDGWRKPLIHLTEVVFIMPLIHLSGKATAGMIPLIHLSEGTTTLTIPLIHLSERADIVIISLIHLSERTAGNTT